MKWYLHLHSMEIQANVKISNSQNQIESQSRLQRTQS